MKSEIEARLLEVDVLKFVEKLKACGAEFVGDWLQLRNCYDFNPVRKNSWIRLRKEGKKTTLTIKEINNNKIDGTKESEIEVSDFDTTNEILNKLGYVARSVQENRRVRYMLNGVEIDIDFWPLIPAYVEFEAKSEQDIKNVCKLLGFDYLSLTSNDVSSIYLRYGFDLTKMGNDLKLSDDVKNFKLNG